MPRRCSRCAPITCCPTARPLAGRFMRTLIAPAFLLRGRTPRAGVLLSWGLQEAAMGTWGQQPFECDGACDWAGTLLTQKDKGAFILQTLVSPPDGDCEAVLAAAEVVAALMGRPCPEIASPDAYTET